jgi:MATE family multidrug resistance protein
LLGAGLASLLSETLSLVLGVIIWRNAAATTASRHPIRPSRKELRIQLREGTNIAVGYLGEGGAYALAGLMLGWFGAVTLAANQLVHSVASVLYMVPLGVSIAVSIRIGQAIGAEERARLITIGKAALFLIVAWMSLVMIAILLGARPMSEALSSDPEVIALAISLFFVVALMQIGDGVQGTMLGAARGMMDNRVPVIITLICYWIVALPSAYVIAFVLDVGPQGIWIGYGAGLAIAATLLTRRYFAMAAQKHIDG